MEQQKHIFENYSQPPLIALLKIPEHSPTRHTIIMFVLILTDNDDTCHCVIRIRQAPDSVL